MDKHNSRDDDFHYNGLDDYDDDGGSGNDVISDDDGGCITSVNEIIQRFVKKSKNTTEKRNINYIEQSNCIWKLSH